MKNNKLILTIVIYFATIMILPTIIWLFMARVLWVGEATILSWMQFVTFGVLTAVFILMFGRHLLAEFKKIKGFWHYFRHVLGGWALLIFLLVASQLFLAYLRGGEVEVAQNQYIIEGMMDSYPLIMAVTVVFFAPFIEEVVFRLAMMNLIKWPVAGILASSFIFGLMHVIGDDFLNILPYMAMGIPLGLSYHRTKNIWYPIGIHFLQNLMGALMILLLTV